ncbi:putative RNA-directed DNA polymerase, eukaryota, reverse transcriptase zinc-binding domain protein, partial [Tanacetum coccineum]
DCGSNKAPGPDGFSFAFVKKYWDLLKKDIFEFVDLFLASGTMPQGANSSFSCLSRRASILINGSPTSEFSIKRSLRQRDPLSPFLFILVMEGLHCAMSNAVSSGLICRIKIGSSDITLSHLFYANDVIITTNWNSRDLDNIIRVLHVFYLASGLKINIHKSNIFGIGVCGKLEGGVE